MNGAATRPARGGAVVDVVLRVEGSVEALRRSVECLVMAATATPLHVIVVADSAPGSAEPIDAVLRGIAAPADVTVLRPEPHTLERALALHRDRDVVLVASGAEVHGDWLDRLVSHAQRDGSGAVGTCSNAGSSSTARCTTSCIRSNSPRGPAGSG